MFFILIYLIAALHMAKLKPALDWLLEHWSGVTPVSLYSNVAAWAR